MRYVILRDDDTNALTPVECLERLYRPFLEQGLPVNLAVIPKVQVDVHREDGSLEGFLLDRKGSTAKLLPMASNPRLVSYLLENPGYCIAQHGYHHTQNEFDSADAEDIRLRLAHGTDLLLEAGFPKPKTFVAPYDKISRVSYKQIAGQFNVISTGWFELRRLPLIWWPRYLRKKILRRPHWRVGPTYLLSHPGCILSCYREREGMLDRIRSAIERQTLTVLVTHWWEYFREHRANESFIEILHQVAAFLARSPDIRVISFDDLARGEFPIF